MRCSAASRISSACFKTVVSERDATTTSSAIRQASWKSVGRYSGLDRGPAEGERLSALSPPCQDRCPHPGERRVLLRQATCQLLGDPLGVRTEPQDHREGLAAELLGMGAVFFREIEIAFFQRGGSLGGLRSSQDQPGAKIGDERIFGVHLLEPFSLFLGGIELSALEQRLGIEGDRSRGSTPGRCKTGHLARLVRLAGGEQEPGEHVAHCGSQGALGRYIGHERLEDVDGLFHAGQIPAPAEHDGPGQALLRCVGLGALRAEQLEGLLPGAGPVALTREHDGELPRGAPFVGVAVEHASQARLGNVEAPPFLVVPRCGQLDVTDIGITFDGRVEGLVGGGPIGGGPAALGLDQLGPRELDALLGLGDGRLDLEASQARLGRIGAPFCAW